MTFQPTSPLPTTVTLAMNDFIAAMARMSGKTSTRNPGGSGCTTLHPTPPPSWLGVGVDGGESGTSAGLDTFFFLEPPLLEGPFLFREADGELLLPVGGQDTSAVVDCWIGGGWLEILLKAHAFTVSTSWVSSSLSSASSSSSLLLDSAASSCTGNKQCMVVSKKGNMYISSLKGRMQFIIPLHDRCADQES
jgi:hypothetical protein